MIINYCETESVSKRATWKNMVRTSEGETVTETVWSEVAGGDASSPSGWGAALSGSPSGTRVSPKSAAAAAGATKDRSFLVLGSLSNLEEAQAEEEKEGGLRNGRNWMGRKVGLNKEEGAGEMVLQNERQEEMAFAAVAITTSDGLLAPQYPPAPSLYPCYVVIEWVVSGSFRNSISFTRVRLDRILYRLPCLSINSTIQYPQACGFGLCPVWRIRISFMRVSIPAENFQLHIILMKLSLPSFLLIPTTWKRMFTWWCKTKQIWYLWFMEQMLPESDQG